MTLQNPKEKAEALNNQFLLKKTQVIYQSVLVVLSNNASYLDF